MVTYFEQMQVEREKRERDPEGACADELPSKRARSQSRSPSPDLGLECIDMPDEYYALLPGGQGGDDEEGDEEEEEEEEKDAEEGAAKAPMDVDAEEKK